MDSEDGELVNRAESTPLILSPFSAFIEEWKAKLPDGLLTNATAFFEAHPFASICAGVTVALSFFPTLAFIVYTLVTLLLTILAVLVIEGALLALGTFVLLSAMLLSFVIATGISGLAFAVWMAGKLLSRLLGRKSKLA